MSANLTKLVSITNNASTPLYFWDTEHQNGSPITLPNGNQSTDIGWNVPWVQNINRFDNHHMYISSDDAGKSIQFYIWQNDYDVYYSTQPPKSETDGTSLIAQGNPIIITIANGALTATTAPKG
jgi:hypothetical protein